ncbi:MAG: sensor histidine kinase [Mycobacteriales bacterium]
MTLYGDNWPLAERPRLAWWVRLTAVPAVTVAAARATPHPGLHGQHLLAAVALAVAVAGSLGWLLGPRSALPASVVAMVAAGGVLTTLTHASPAVLFLMVGAAAAGLNFELPHAVAVGAAGVAGLLLTGAATGRDVTGLLGWVLATALVLQSGRGRRQYHLRMEQAQMLVAQTERARQEEAKVAALAERGRLAREIHDVLAHALSALAVQLDAADALLAGDDPVRARQFVLRARNLAKDGLAETRRAVAAMRGDTVPLASVLESLVTTYRDSTGAPATLAVTGTPDTLPGDTTLALVRVAQEAFTNIGKHAPGAAVSVTLRHTEAGMVLTVRNDEPPPGQRPLAGTGGGYGLAGMRERVGQLGGTVSAGPDGGGFRVEAKIPA